MMQSKQPKVLRLRKAASVLRQSLEILQRTNLVMSDDAEFFCHRVLVDRITVSIQYHKSYITSTGLSST
jgi:hypothetical protein